MGNPEGSKQIAEWQKGVEGLVGNPKLEEIIVRNKSTLIKGTQFKSFDALAKILKRHPRAKFTTLLRKGVIRRK